MAHEILDELTCIGIERMLWKLYNFSRAHTINVCALVNVLCLDICRRMHSGCWLLRRFLDSVSWNKSKNGRPAYQFFPSNVDARKKLYRSARTRKWRAKIDRFNIEKSRIEPSFFLSLDQMVHRSTQKNIRFLKIIFPLEGNKYRYNSAINWKILALKDRKIPE